MGDKVGMDFPAELSLLQLPHVIWAWQTQSEHFAKAARPCFPFFCRTQPIPVPAHPGDWMGLGYLLPQPAASAGAAGSTEGRSNTQDQPALWLHASLSKKPQSWNQYQAFGCKSLADPQAGLEQAGGVEAHAPPSALGTGSGAQCQL